MAKKRASTAPRGGKPQGLTLQIDRAGIARSVRCGEQDRQISSEQYRRAGGAHDQHRRKIKADRRRNWAD